jgi:hypothetical protein
LGFQPWAMRLPVPGSTWHGTCTYSLMHPPFVDSDSHLPEDAPWEGPVHTHLGRVLVVAILIAVAASVAAVLVT